MPWVEVLAVFVVCHAAGDFLLQTDWQARRKSRGLGRDPERRRALAAHTLTYTLAFVPAVAWLGGRLGAGGVVALIAAIALPHAIQDDGRLLRAYVRAVKGVSEPPGPLLVAIDQSFHLLALFAVAQVAGA